MHSIEDAMQTLKSAANEAQTELANAFLKHAGELLTLVMGPTLANATDSDIRARLQQICDELRRLEADVLNVRLG